MLAACDSAKEVRPEQPTGPTKPYKATNYQNPVINSSCPDPTVLKAKDGFFYLYATEDDYNIPIYKSKDLVNWTLVGHVFTDTTRPAWLKGKMWAPDAQYINGKYVLYFADGVWGGEKESSVGVATADHPEGPFTDSGAPLITFEKYGVMNSIDEYFISDNGKNYMFWGSFRGIYGIELTADGLHVKEGAVKQKIADGIEGTYILKKDGYYYLFGSKGSCCEGAKSTYNVICARSKSLFGPYEIKHPDWSIMDGHGEQVVQGNSVFAGPGHNAEFQQDDKGDYWMIYHAYKKADPDNGRVVMLDKILWTEDGWPYVKNLVPSSSSEVPAFKGE